MSRNYLEIEEVVINNFDIPMLIKVEVIDEADAIEKAMFYKDAISGDKIYKYIESHHFENSEDNKPCDIKYLELS